jgi:chorismate-pyruvate lyase
LGTYSIVKLSEELVKSDREFLPLELKPGTEVIERRILLRGSISRKNYIYAESLILLDNLDEHFRNELLKNQTPIGKIWLEKRVETLKKLSTPANIQLMN